MRKAISTAGVILLAIISLPLAAAEPGSNKPKDAQLKTRAFVYRYSEPSGTPLAPSPRGEARIDILHYLKWNTPIIGSPGAEAVWFPNTRVLATKLTDEDYSKLKDALFDPEDRVEIPMLELNLSVWEFRLASEQASRTTILGGHPINSSAGQDARVSELLLERSSPGAFGGLKKSSDTLLRKTHSQTLVTLSERAVAGVNGRTVVLKNGARPLLKGKMGSAIRFEPVVGPDHLSADFHVDYHVRIPSIKTEIIEMIGSGDYTVLMNGEVVAKTAMSSAAKEEGLGYGVVLSVRIHTEDPKVRAAADAAAIKAALAEMER